MTRKASFPDTYPKKIGEVRTDIRLSRMDGMTTADFKPSADQARGFWQSPYS
jgi:hypothetical protein